MKIYNSLGVEIADVIVSDDSYRYRAIMGENALTLTFPLPTFIEIPVGSYCDFQNERYTLLRPQNFKKNSSRNFEYTLILESASGVLSRYKFRDSTSKRLKFSNTARPQEHLEMLVWNLNQRDSGWSVGIYVDSVEKVISFSHTDCSEALRMIAEAFNTEFEIVGKVISIKKVEYNKSAPLSLSYGFGNGFKSGVKRENFNDSKAVEILFVQGGEKNIEPSSYGSQTLLLPISKTLVYEGRSYVSDANGYLIKRSDKALSTNIEDSLDLSNIYPQRVGVISSVVTVSEENNLYDFIDSSIQENLNYVDCLISGEKMTVIFQSGMLAGKEFDVSYTHSTRKFAIVPQEVDGVTMPNETFKPVVDDTYAVFGISLPATYVCDDVNKTGASWDMFREAAKYLYENEDPRFSFTGELDGIWAKNDWLNIGGKIKLGGFVSFTDEQFQTTPVLIRMTGIKDLINSPHSPQIELSNITVGGSTSSLIKGIPSKEVLIEDAKKESIRFAKRGFRDAQETAKMIQASLLNFSGSISPITVQTMHLMVGDESLQFEFVANQNSTDAIPHDESFNPVTKQFVSDAGVIQHKTLGIANISSSRSASDFKWWSIDAFDSGFLDVPEQSYYVYAKVSKTANTGVFLLSETPISIEHVAGYYHLLLGILNSENNGDRSYSAMYGYSELSPSRLTVKKVVSPNGQTYFDLENNEIAGNLKFRASDNSLKSVEQGINETGRGNNIFPQAEFQNGLTGWTISGLALDANGVNYNETWALGGNTNLNNTQGLNTIFLRHDYWSNAFPYADVESPNIQAIVGGKRYCVSVYSGAHRCKVGIYLFFYNEAGDFVGYAGDSAYSSNDQEAAGGKTLAGYKRIYAIGNAPATAVRAAVILRKYDTVLAEPEYTDSYAFFCRPMVEEVDTLTTNPGAWKPYASSGDVNAVREVANNAISLLADIASDGKLTPNEKISVKREWLSIQNQYAIINQQCGVIGSDDYSENATYTDFVDYYNELNSYITPLLSDLTVTSDIVITTFNSKFTNCYAGFEAQKNQNTLQVNIQSKSADYIKAAIKGTTEVNGGLVTTNILGVKDSSNVTTAGMNGIVGAGNDIRFWAGETIENMENAPFRVYEDGRIALGRESDGNAIDVSMENIPTLTEIEAREVYDIEFPQGSVFEVVKQFDNPADYPHTPEVHVEAYFMLKYDGVYTIDIVALCSLNSSTTHTIVIDELYTKVIRMSDNAVIELGTVTDIRQLENSSSESAINFVDKALSKGLYKLEARAKCHGTVNASNSTIYAQVGFGVISYKHIIKKLAIGLDGIALFDTMTENFFRLSLTDPDYLIRAIGGLKWNGNTDLPGVLASGNIGSAGNHGTKWGSKVSSSNATYTATGIYDVPHLVGSTAYNVIATPIGDGLHAFIISKSNNSFRIQIRNNIGTAIAGAFDYIITGNN